MIQLVLLLVFAPAAYAANGAQNAHDRSKDSVITKVVQMLAEEKDKIAIDLRQNELKWTSISISAIAKRMRRTIKLDRLTERLMISQP
jgi:hypothetical protein